MPAVVIWTDGSCFPNPGPGGWAAVVLRDDVVSAEISGAEAATSNNRMELMGAIRALEALGEPHEVQLNTDSQYVQRGITRWVISWRRRNWRTGDNKPVLNRDLWERLIEAERPHRVEWNWVRGHDGNRWNERADLLAGTARQSGVSSGSSPARLKLPRKSEIEQLTRDQRGDLQLDLRQSLREKPLNFRSPRRRT